ncbi:MAG: family 16 glycosylhydrolase [Gallionella sp.]|jgi:beta-glucanase (GH16 family)|nr:family 16 glycosylhydrolase [Gallionella sp.]MCK9353561.1 family 16 glycosylhydrolase [Gallionella sp.]
MNHRFSHSAALAVLACMSLFSGNSMGATPAKDKATPPAVVALQNAWLLGGVTATRGEVKPLFSQKSGWKLVPQMSDEFGGKALDIAKWDNDVKDWGVWSWEPENAWVDNGRLNMRMKYEEHRRGQWTLFYKSGIVKSKAPPIRYGYFEARIKAASRFPGVAPAFWAYRDDGSEWTEIDFVELTQRRHDVTIIDTDIHVFKQVSFPGTLPLQEVRSWKSPWDPRSAFHVYGCEWDEKEIRWYIDGRLVQARKNDYWHQALDITLSLGVRGDLKTTATPEGFPTTAQVDYVRVWTTSN